MALLSISMVYFVDNETPGGTQNSSNQVFTLARVPNPAASLDLTLNGGRQKQGADYTLSGSTITYLVAKPAKTDVQVAFYRVEG